MSRVPLSTSKEPRMKPHWRRHWLRWVLGVLFALIALLVLAAIAVIRLQPSQPPLALPAGVAAAPAGRLDGTWHVVTGSVAGFRVRESFLGIGNDVTGRTDDVTGTAVVSTGRLTRATFQVSLDAITVNGRARQPQLVQSLDVAAHPIATVTLADPVTLPAAFTSGGTITRTATGTLTLNGITRPVTVTLSARRDGTAMQAAGSLPVTFADFDIKGPHGYGGLGSLAGNGTAEFLLILAPIGVGA